jgi:hypothetical protein
VAVSLVVVLASEKAAFGKPSVPTPKGGQMRRIALPRYGRVTPFQIRHHVSGRPKALSRPILNRSLGFTEVLARKGRPSDLACAVPPGALTLKQVMSQPIVELKLSTIRLAGTDCSRFTNHEPLEPDFITRRVPHPVIYKRQ